MSFRIDWFDLLAVQGTQESSLALQFESINSSALSLLYYCLLLLYYYYSIIISSSSIMVVIIICK